MSGEGSVAVAKVADETVTGTGVSAPTKVLLWTPIRHRDRHLGNFFLGDKEGGRRFTAQDEEVLRLFASPAATAIANARTHRDEQRARADLEALIETSPVAVLVVNATGEVVSLNQEARRIVEGLRSPGRPTEELLKVATCRRADGRLIALDELPLARRLEAPETVRAEEFVLSVPDGRSVRTLINATPIHSANGVESLVVTMQDLAPLEELERLRTEFLARVSHELPAPLTSIIGSVTALLRAAPGLDPAEMQEFFRIIDAQANHMRVLISDLLDAGRIETGTLSVAPEPTEVARLVDQARNTFLSGGGRHAVLLDLPTDLTRVMADRQRIVQGLNNLFSNAARHAPESSPIRVAAGRDGVYVAVSVSDEGPGVPPDRLPHLFQKHAGVFARGRESGTAGTGLGLAICKGLVEAHGGRIWAESGEQGQGIRFTFTLPTAEETGGSAADALAAGRSRSCTAGSGRCSARHRSRPRAIASPRPHGPRPRAGRSRIGRAGSRPRLRTPTDTRPTRRPVGGPACAPVTTRPASPCRGARAARGSRCRPSPWRASRPARHPLRSGRPGGESRRRRTRS